MLVVTLSHFKTISITYLFTFISSSFPYVLLLPMLASSSPSPEKIEGEAKIIRNVQNEIITKPQNPVSERHPIVRAVSAEVKTSSRGTAMMLPKRFLSVPHYRVLERTENEEKISFTITFNRKHNKLGITIQEMTSLIQITVVHRSASGQMLLAESAGVCVGDILAGINGERFGPWAELKDVMDLLTLSGHFVTIQFDRYKRSSVWYNAIYQAPSNAADSTAPSKLTSITEYPSRMKIFLENSVITVEQTPILESTIRYLKYRDVEWSASSLAEKINIWHLDAPSEESPTSPTSSREAVTGSVRLSKTSQTKSSNRRHSLDSAVLAEIVRQEMADDQRYMQKYSDIETHNLRPALSVRLLRAEQGRGDYIVYVIWVLDVRSGVEWIIRRRYREFEVFRETIIGIRKKLQNVEFPQKHLAAVTDKSVLIQERLNVLQRFLRRIAGIITLNSHHPSTIKLQLVLQRFLNVEENLDMIILRESDPATHLVKTVEVFMHNVLHMTFMDRALQGFIENYMGNPLDDIHRRWSEEEACKVAEEQKEFLDRLQNFLFEALFEDCVDIITSVIQESGAHTIPNKVSELIDQMTASTSSHSQSRAAQHRSSKRAHSTASDDGSALSLMNPHSGDSETIDELINLSSDEFRCVIRDAVRRQVETEIYLATIGRIDFIMQQVYEAADRQFFERTCKLCHQPQSYFDIYVDHISPSSWEASIAAFKVITQKTLPCDKINALLEMSRGIFQLYRAEHPDASQPLSADDLLPIFIYIMVQAQLPSMISLLNTLQYLCAEDKRMSEAGYYLATLQASVTHILEADLRRERPFNAQLSHGPQDRFDEE